MRVSCSIAAALAVACAVSLPPARAGAAQESPAASACPEPKRGPGDVVRALYAAYPFDGRRAIHDEPREVLASYFDAKLVGLFLEDQACVRREEGICHVSGDLLFDAQDAAITEFRLCGSSRGAEWIDVRFKNFGEDQVVSYRLTTTRAGWRIADVVYRQGSSLVDLLSGPP